MSSNSCIKCGEITGLSSSTATYTLQTCQACTATNCTECKDGDATKCKTCSVGYMREADESCSVPTVGGCKIGSTATGCTSCEDG